MCTPQHHQDLPVDITIESIDTSAMKPLGLTQLPSYPVRFSSATVSGAARFVPFGDDASEYLGRTLCVELATERVTGFERIAPRNGEGFIVALDEQFAFKVVGQVGSVRCVAEPPGNVVITVAAGTATFLLSSEDFPDTSLEEGDNVTFLVHELSLWDEEI